MFELSPEIVRQVAVFVLKDPALPRRMAQLRQDVSEHEALWELWRLGFVQGRPLSTPNDAADLPDHRPAR
jgi:hypothetical protein